MFQIAQQQFGKFKSYTLHEPGKKGYLKCIPEFGANIIELQLENNGKSFQILDGFSSEEQLRENTKSRGIHLAPFPNRIRDGKYPFDGIAYQLPINKPKEQNAIHGFIWDKPFNVIEEKSEKDHASLSMGYNYNGEFTSYPFLFQIKYSYQLSPDGLAVSVQVMNTGDSNLPFGVGWHPYFTFHKPVDELELQLPACTVLDVDERMIPTGTANPYPKFEHLTSIGSTSFDTAFKLSDSDDSFITRLYDPAEKTTIVLTQDQHLPYLQVYIPPDRNSIALEPMSCPANAFNSGEGLVVLKPGEKFESKMNLGLV